MGRGIYTLNIIKDSILDFIYPKPNFCIICKEEGEGICRECLNKIVYCNSEDISIAYYNSVLKRLILDFKFKKNFIAGEILVDLLEKKLRDIPEEYILTFVPMSKKKLKQRGFNQCEYLCMELSKRTKREVLDTLIQIGDMKEQKTLGKDERKTNVKDIFKVKKDVTKKKFILIDDVITTGATINECKKMLLESGAIEIKLLTIGKSDI